MTWPALLGGNSEPWEPSVKLSAVSRLWVWPGLTFSVSQFLRLDHG